MSSMLVMCLNVRVGINEREARAYNHRCESRDARI